MRTFVYAVCLLFAITFVHSADDKRNFAYLIKGVAYNAKNKSAWQSSFSNTSSAPFKDLTKRICISLRYAVNVNMTFGNAWDNCLLIRAEEGSTIVYANVTFLIGVFEDEHIDYHSEELDSAVRDTIEKYAKAPQHPNIVRIGEVLSFENDAPRNHNSMWKTFISVTFVMLLIGKL